MNLNRKFTKAARLIADGNVKELFLDVLMQFSFGHELIRNAKYLYLRRQFRPLVGQYTSPFGGGGNEARKRNLVAVASRC